MTRYYFKNEDDVLNNINEGDEIVLLNPYGNSFHIKYYTALKPINDISIRDAIKSKLLTLADIQKALPFTFVEDHNPDVTENIIPGSMWLNYNTGDVYMYKQESGWELFQSVTQSITSLAQIGANSVTVLSAEAQTFIIQFEAGAIQRIIQVYKKNDQTTVTVEMFSFNGTDFDKTYWLEEHMKLAIKNYESVHTTDQDFYKKATLNFSGIKEIAYLGGS